jgi:uncharacterized protein (UPF0264 family)
MNMAELLVSVRSVAEAEAALAGGAGLIDIKEPARGALGRADRDVITAILDVVASRRPVSAALGEWAERVPADNDARLTYVKWGLAGCARLPEWRHKLAALLEGRRPQVVLVAYADWQCAQAPSIDEVFALACEYPGSVILLDTYCKDASNSLDNKRPTLLNWLGRDDVLDLCAQCRASEIKIALAGSLGASEISELMEAQPNWFAVRGAVCADGDRHDAVQADKVRRLTELCTASLGQVRVTRPLAEA